MLVTSWTSNSTNQQYHDTRASGQGHWKKAAAKALKVTQRCGSEGSTQSFCKERSVRTSLVVQWLRLCAPKARSPGSVAAQGTRSRRACSQNRKKKTKKSRNSQIKKKRKKENYQINKNSMKKDESISIDHYLTVTDLL